MVRSSSYRLATAMIVPIVSTCLLYMIACSDAQRVDCRKFVFAPMCRGVAAKRGYNLDAGEDDVYVDNDGKLSGMASYPSVPTLVGKAHTSVHRQKNQLPTKPFPWKSLDDNSKSDTLYDWYLTNRKRAREPDMVYDY